MADPGRILLPAAVLAGALATVEAAVAARLLPPTIAPPSAIARNLIEARGPLWHHLEPTLLTASTGFLVALAIALALAALVYAVRWLEAAAMTMGTVLDSIPMIALAPVLVLWMGLSLPMRITIATVLCLFPIFVSVLQGLKSAPPAALDLFASLAASPFQRLRMLALPCALPYLFVGLRIAAPLSILGALIAEWNGAERGLGVYILNAMFALRSVDLWTGVAIACAVSSCAYLLIGLFERLSIGSLPEHLRR